jgi:mRNA interferase MazF
VTRAYVPDAGDLVWLTFDQAGHEQRGRRPALILSPRIYNGKARRALACPVTSHWEARRVVFEAKVPAEILTEVRERLRAPLEL